MKTDNNHLSVDEEIYSCLNLERPRSFFLFAGAGSGKTRTLVRVLQRFRNENSHRLRLSGQKVAIITYTNAACDEIKRRLEYDSIFVVSTIHSFAWELIKTFQNDIKEWIKKNLELEIIELEEKQATGKVGTKAAIDRERQISLKKNRSEHLKKVKMFTYNPNGINSGRDSLNHAEVISMTASFLANQPLMQKILVRKYPILLIDESQDTKKELIEAFFNIQNSFQQNFSLGLFGDTMQRIYNDGKTDLGKGLPDEWAKPTKIVNYRCPKRIIVLINKIRSEVNDGHIQKPSENNVEGIVRLFIVDTKNTIDKSIIESQVMNHMLKITGDNAWSVDGDIKILTLEHHMAAKRGGFFDLFEPLYKVDKISTSLLDGTLSGMSFFTQQLLPLIKAKQQGDEFAVARIVRKYSPILSKSSLKESKNSVDEIKRANSGVESLFALWKEQKEPTLVSLLQEVARLNLFPIPDSLNAIAYPSTEDLSQSENSSDLDEVTTAWETALKSPFSQLEAYANYISDKSKFGTHQGVKGLEFPRVMVIIDDEEARGFLFSYEKLFGAKEPSDTDRKNIAEGKETSIDRTRRLFYVTCSRAEKSLAIIAYTQNPGDVKYSVIKQGWFDENEVINF